jgi:hypothetical protein
MATHPSRPLDVIAVDQEFAGDARYPYLEEVCQAFHIRQEVENQTLRDSPAWQAMAQGLMRGLSASLGTPAAGIPDQTEVFDRMLAATRNPDAERQIAAMRDRLQSVIAELATDAAACTAPPCPGFEASPLRPLLGHFPEVSPVQESTHHRLVAAQKAIAAELGRRTRAYLKRHGKRIARELAALSPGVPPPSLAACDPSMIGHFTIQRIRLSPLTPRALIEYGMGLGAWNSDEERCLADFTAEAPVFSDGGARARR